MIEMRAKLAAQLMGGTLVGPNSLFKGVSTDTRLLQPGELFFALKGENFDAHAFLDQAVDKGAAGLVTEDDFETTIDCIRVASCEQALTGLASDWRNRFEMPLVAITGSNGKTTVKEMVTAILSEQGEVSSTQGNLNNHIGVPLTLLRLSSNHDFAVTELGANHIGEIRSLSQLAKPTVGVVTQCAPAHLEGFGSIDDVAKAKGELFEHLGTGSTAVINADDHYAPLWHELAKPATCLTFGLKSAADVSATWVGDGASTRIVLLTPAGSTSLEIQLPGRHNVMNVLAATAATLPLGVPLDSICQGLQKMQPVSGRLVLRELDEARVLDDSYNANPTSLKAGLEVLAEYPNKRWLILGDMAELGSQSTRLHRDAGALARELGVERMFCYGDFAREACESFGEGGEHFGDIDTLIASVRDGISNRPTILIKGSRSMRMERIVTALEATN